MQSIPPKVLKTLYGVFDKCKNLQIVEFSEESQLDCILFSAFDDINVILMIPSSLKMVYSLKKFVSFTNYIYF